jgi:enoyl-CoA hydratase/carnithine racemase
MESSGQSAADRVSSLLARQWGRASTAGPGYDPNGRLSSTSIGSIRMTDSPLLLRDDSDGVATITLNRPHSRNALSLGLMEALNAELMAIASNPPIRVVVIAAAGPAFCAGHDMREMRAAPTREAYEAVFALCASLMQRIVSLPKPVIARVHGAASAAGCQLVATCDLAIAGESACFATPGVNIGLFCSTPMVALSRAVGRKAAMEMLLTGDLIDANRAREIGLVNRVVPDAELNTAVTALARQIAGKSPLTLAIGKAAFHRQVELDLAAAYALTADVMTRNMLAHDAEEGIDAFLEKRDPVWTGT